MSQALTICQSRSDVSRPISFLAKRSSCMTDVSHEHCGDDGYSGVFTPVDWNGRLLGDGGLVNNLPTDVAKDMGADVVIGVTLRVAPANVFRIAHTDRHCPSDHQHCGDPERGEKPSPRQHEITVDLGNRNSLSFQETKVIIDAGYAAASMNEIALQKLSVSPEEWEAYRRQKESRRRSLPPSGRVARVTADDAGIAKSAARELNRKVGDGVSAKNLEPPVDSTHVNASLPNAYFGWRSQPTPAGYDIEIEERRSNGIHAAAVVLLSVLR
jgi:hypothetical protein